MSSTTFPHDNLFDLLVIGGGSGGVRAARLAAARGKRVGLIEARHLGGTCVNVGCVPKKLYHYAANYAYAFQEARGYGWTGLDQTSLDWPRLRQQRATEIERLRAVYERNLRDAHVHLLHGWARFLAPDRLEVDGQVLQARHVLIATGGEPSIPTIPGANLGVTSNDMFDLPAIPRRLVVVGGGYIACEMASIFQGLGAQVTLLQRASRLLKGFDMEIAGHLAGELRLQGIRIELDAETLAVDGREDGEKCVRWKDAQGLDQMLKADIVLFATGRRPALPTEFGLASVGVELDEHGRIPIDSRYRTRQPTISAIGDVSTAKPLTPVAVAEAMRFVDALYGVQPGARSRQLDYRHVPTAVFTHPAIGSIGDSEEAAVQRFGDVDVYCSQFVSLKHALTGQKLTTLVKLVVDVASDRVVGLHIVGEDAGEIVQGFAVAMNAGATKADFDDTVGLHPTIAEELVTLRAPFRQHRQQRRTTGP